MDKYQEMRVFTAVVDSASFVAASESLGMSKAAVSRYVSELEQRLGVRLMHRTTRRLSLTPEGELFLARCREILASIDASEAELSTRRVTASGLLKVSVPVSFGMRHLAPLWSEFLKKHPQVTLDVQLADRVIDLVDEGFDLAVRIARLPDSSLISRQLTSTRLVLCAAPSYLRRDTRLSSPSMTCWVTACFQRVISGSFKVLTGLSASKCARACGRTMAIAALQPAWEAPVFSCSPHF